MLRINRIKNSAKKLLILSTAAAASLAMSLTAFADEPYNSYSYDTWDEPIPSQSGYRVERTINGDGMDFQLIGRYYGADGESEINIDETTGLSNFMEPGGLFVTTSPSTGDLTVYLADTENARALRLKIVSETEAEIVTEFTRPDNGLYSNETFMPNKILADNAENVYVVVRSVNSGAVQFSSDGSFTGYYGANRVQVTAAVIAQNLWRKIASNEQIEGMRRNVPVEYANFDMDDDGFIYTVTETNVETDAVKKLNPAGYNIWDNSVGDKYEFGDIISGLYDATRYASYSTRLTDIDIGANGLMNVLDYETGRVFQYDRNARLICIFSTKNSTSDQKGTVTSPNAIETVGRRVFLLDGTKNDVTIFVETAFGAYLHNAFELYDQGRYTDAVADWKEVIKRDGCYTMAYIGLGKAALNNEEFTEALDYFKTAYDQDDYDKAFKYARDDFMRENFTAFVIVILVLIVLLIVRAVLKKKGIKLIKKKAKEAE